MTDTAAPKPASVASWKKARKHNILCPSGVRVDIVIPDLPRMIEAGNIPQHLLDAALGVATDAESKPSADLIKQQREFSDVLVMLTVEEPKLSEADLPDIPFEDRELIVALATRQRDIDAEGEHIGGLMKSDKFRKFRGFSEFDETVEGA